MRHARDAREAPPLGRGPITAAQLGDRWVQLPLLELRYEILIAASPERIWPWLKQVGYHRGGWYIDTWWNRIAELHFWPRVVPIHARGSYQAPANEILPEFQDLSVGDIVPDGPAGSAYYLVTRLEENRLLLLEATTHFDYMAPSFVYRTRLAPRGSFRWAFILEEGSPESTRLVSWWQAEARPDIAFRALSPLIKRIDGAHQRQILKGIKRRAERREP